MALSVFHSTQEWIGELGEARAKTALSIGNFDGLHCGHQEILREVIQRAAEHRALSAIVTFDPHPLRVLRPAQAPPMLATTAQKLAMIAALGVEAALVLRFDAALAAISAQQFVEEILVRALRAAVIVVGSNFRFGHRQSGDVALLQALGRRAGFQVQCVAPLALRGQVVSSTGIREAVVSGNMARAHRWLGRPFSVEGTVQRATRIGARLVVPTLNLLTTQELLPPIGVYATETEVDGQTYRSVTNIGFRPTFDGRNLTIETHLFDFSQELSAGKIAIFFWKRLRDEKKFSDPQHLKAQVQSDAARAQQFFRLLERARLKTQTARS